MNADNPHSPDPRSSAPSAVKFKRYDMKKLLADPELRRKLIVQGTIATQAREGIDVTEAEAQDSYYVVTQAERAAFFGLHEYRSEAGENDGRHIAFVEGLGTLENEARHDVQLKSFENIDGAPLAYSRMSVIGAFFRENPSLSSIQASAYVGLQTSNDAKFLRYFWEISSTQVKWVSFSKGGVFSRFYRNYELVVNWEEQGREIKKCEDAYVRNEAKYFSPGLTWASITSRGFAVQRMDAGKIFSHVGPAIIPESASDIGFLSGALNSSLLDYIISSLTARTWWVGYVNKLPIPAITNSTKGKCSDLEGIIYKTKSDWDTGNEICTRFSLPWILQPECADGAKTLSAALDQVFRHEVFLDAQLTETYARLNDEVYRLYGVNAELRAKIETAIGQRPPELVWPQMEGKDRDQKRREHVDRLLTYLVKQILTKDEDHLVCLQRVAHEPPLLERLREKLTACFPAQDPSSLETEVVNELKKKTKGYHRAESLAEWLHDVFFETHNALYQQRPLLWHLASSQTRTEPGFACLVHAHHFDADALAKLRSVYIRDRIAVLKREAAQAGNDGKPDLRFDLLALAEEVEAYDAKLALLQEGAHTGPEGGDRDYRILTPWKTPETRPQGWHPDVDDGIKVNLAPLARTNLLRRRLRLGESKEED